MKFCEKCENMFYLQLSPDDENQIIYKCRNCGNEDSEIQNKDLCVLSYNKEKKTDYLKYGGNSEFCGHTYDNQLDKIKLGLNKFKSKNSFLALTIFWRVLNFNWNKKCRLCWECILIKF